MSDDAFRQYGDLGSTVSDEWGGEPESSEEMSEIWRQGRWERFAAAALTGIAMRGPSNSGEQAFAAASMADAMEREYQKRFPTEACGCPYCLPEAAAGMVGFPEDNEQTAPFIMGDRDP